MAAHRYWRLFISAAFNSQYVTIGELTFATTPGGASVATGGTASASSFWPGSLPAKAFKGASSPNDWWSSNGGGSAWLQYDLGSGNEKDIVEMRIYFPAGNAGYTDQAPSSFSLHYSDDGANWTRQSQWSGQSFAAGETKTFDATPIPDFAISNRIVLDKRFRFNSAALAQSEAFSSVRHFSRLFAPDNYLTPMRLTPYTGNKRIAGSTTELGLPSARKVHLLEQKSGMIIDTRHTRADGLFEFAGIAAGTYTVLGVDSSGAQNSVVYAHVEAVD
ncbi:discoidin domain-containing protein [Aquabacterium sp.]|uniref:discoidin domain-containing protein n=1 Tax=Aquabacterium sp. TaxID=1872578 RepID=UPI0026135733|nr:discoidin domain-containing protein [Aquabacterium sp.]MDD2978125.1 discoidin domain-containing protein [Aquabacterium sp.]